MSIRKEARLQIRAIRRHTRMQMKVTTLLQSCSCEIIDKNLLNSDDIAVLREAYVMVRSRDIDYYPIPKRLNKKLRQYVHDHPIFFEDSLFEYIASSMVNSDEGLYSQLFRNYTYSNAFNMEDLIRVLSSYQPIISSPSWL